MTTYKINDKKCPKCGHKLSHASSFELYGRKAVRKPQQGDVTICNECGTILIFTKDLGFEVADQKMIDSWDDDSVIAIMKAQAVIKQMIEGDVAGIVGMALIIKGAKMDSHQNKIDPMKFYHVEKMEDGKVAIYEL